MPHLLVRHKVSDFSKWKPAYDAHSPARKEAGLQEEHLLRNMDNPNEIFLLFEVKDVEKAKEFGASANLREAMQDTDNHRSQAVCDRAGLKKEGVLRQAEWLYDHFLDMSVNSVLSTEWKENPYRE
jgi:hypothetical protein